MPHHHPTVLSSGNVDDFGQPLTEPLYPNAPKVPPALHPTAASASVQVRPTHSTAFANVASVADASEMNASLLNARLCVAPLSAASDFNACVSDILFVLH